MTILISIIIGIFIGSIVGFGVCYILRQTRSYSGIMKILREENKVVYSLELHEDPRVLEYASEVIFKVETSDESS